MKNLVILLIACACMAHADEIPTKFTSPLNLLHINFPWILEENSKFLVACEHAEDDDLVFSVARGLNLTKKAVLKDLLKQINNSKGDLAKVPLFEASFPYVDEDDGLKFDNWSLNTVHGVEAIQFHMTGESIHTVHYNDTETTFVSYNRGVGYILALDKQFYIIIFVAPEEKFHESEVLFQETLQGLWD